MLSIVGHFKRYIIDFCLGLIGVIVGLYCIIHSFKTEFIYGLFLIGIFLVINGIYLFREGSKQMKHIEDLEEKRLASETKNFELKNELLEIEIKEKT